jgi:glutamate-1-semialdehyde 2,1-aminomutase
LGQLHEDSQYIESLPFNDLEGSIKVLNSIRKDIACIITEPLLGTAGCIPAQIDYLHGLQEYANKNDIFFILDEIVTGFRLSIRGAAHLYNLKPDLFTLGKIVGGGLPIGVLCGKKEIMSLIDPVARRTKERLCLVGGGTFSANPMTMSAGYATLSHIRKNESRLYSRINNLGKKARDGLTKLFSDAKIRVQITGVGSLLMVHFLNDKVGKIVNALDVALSNKELLKLYHLSLIGRYGIFFLPLKMGAFSEAHSDADVKRLVSATQEIINSGLLSRTVNNSE